MLNAAAPYAQTMSSPNRSEANRKLPLGVRFGLFLLVLWTVSQIVSVIPGLPSVLRGVLIKSKVLIGPLALALIGLTHLNALQIKPAFKMLAAFVLYSVFSLLVRANPEWQRALMTAAWGLCFLVVPALLSTPHRIREFIRLALPTMVTALILTIVFALLTGEVSHSDGGRTRYHFGMNPNYFAVIAATVCYAGFAALLLVPSLSRTLCWIAVIGGFVLTILTDCRSQILNLLGSFTIYGAYSQAPIVAKAWRFISAAGVTVGLGFVALLATPLLSIEQANQLSSGRVLLWYSLIKSNLGTGEVLPMLWGQSAVTFDTGLAGWRPLVHMRHDAFYVNADTAALFQRVAFDNAYLETLLMTGVIGLVLALLGWWRWWSALRGNPADTLGIRRTKGIARGCLGGLLISGMFASAWPAIGNVSISFTMVLAIALTAVTRRAESTYGPVGPPVDTWNPPGRIG
jgi:hypothetical protein